MLMAEVASRHAEELDRRDEDEKKDKAAHEKDYIIAA